jgi:hypothetical protein
MIHKLHLTENELQHLALMGYLGNWIANAQAVPDEEPHPELEKVLQKIYKLAKDNHVKRMKITYDFGHYSCVEHDGINSNAYEIIQQYDEQSMFETLAHFLAERDVYRTTKSHKNTSEMELLALETEKYNFYIEEFSKHGLDRLNVGSKN